MIKAILQPGAAILFCLLFGLPFVFVGFQTVEITGDRDQQGQVTIDFQRSHYWGLWRVEERLEDVQNAALKTSLVHRSRPRRIRLTSGVFLESQTEAVQLIAGASNVDDKLKRDTVNDLNAYIQEGSLSAYNSTVSVANIFGWFGLPFLILGILGLIGWPGSILKHWKNMG